MATPIGENKMEVDGDGDGDYEPFDTEKQKYIDEDLMGKYDSQLFTTTRHWKTGPSQVKSKLRKKFRLELRGIALAQYECVKPDPTTEKDNILLGDKNSLSELEDRLKGDSIECAEVNKKCSSLLSKTSQLVGSVILNRELKNSNQYKVLSETPPSPSDDIDMDLKCFSDKTIKPPLNV